MTIKTLILVVIILGALFFGIFLPWWGRRFLRLRCSHKQLWQKSFRPDDIQKVDQILKDICEAFMIPKKYRYSFRPSDEIGSIYEKTASVACDSLEYEHLLDRLEKHFNLKEDELIKIKPLTVGLLVRRVATPVVGGQRELESGN